MFADLTIVTSCVNYGKYLPDWARSIVAQTVRPGRVCIFTHGTVFDAGRGLQAKMMLERAGIDATHSHVSTRLDLGIARNCAVSMASSEWVMHLDADDLLLPHAVAELQRIAPNADVVQAGYERVGQISGMSTRRRLYEGGDGAAMLTKSLASGNSMFRRSLWEQTPYRTDLHGAWDTCLWLGFAHLGARFRPTTTAIFQYRQHPDSVYNRRRTTMGWERVHTSAMIKRIRRDYRGVAIIVPRDARPSHERDRNWKRVRQHYEQYHPDWTIIEGVCPSVVWVKGAAIADALRHCTAEILVIADADVMVDPDALEDAVTRVRAGAAWAMPHLRVWRANETLTATLCREDFFRVPYERDLDRNVYDGAPGGGIVVVPHVMYDAIGGIPFAFRGWGSEDKCLATLCDRLIGPCSRGTADLVHLWHPPQSTIAHAKTNVQLLQNIGHAAQQGRDSLVKMVQAMPRPPIGPMVSKRDPKVTPINHARIQERQEQRRLKR